MGGSDMAALLMADSDSDGSDTEELKNVPASTSAVAAAIQPTASPTPPQQQPKQQQPAAPAPAPSQPPPQNQPPPANKSELSQRLKSLYSPANHASKKAAPAPAPPPSQPPQQAAPSQSAPPPARPPTHATSTSGRPPHHSHHPGAPPPTQPSQASQSSHHMTSQTQMQRQSSQSNRGPPPGSSRSSHPQSQQPGYSSSSSQQAPHYSSHHPSSQSSSQQQPPYSQPPSSYGRTSSSQHRPSSSSGRPPSSSQQPSSSSHRSSSGGGVPNPVPHGSVPAPGQRRGGVTHDPFEPTPLSKIRDREQAAMAAVAARGSSSGSGYPGGSGSASGHPGSSRSGVAASGSSSEREKEMRRQKERFLMFTRVLMKYLETKDPSLHSKVKLIIKECAERNKRNEPGYESVTASMRERLKQVVGDAYWKRAESYLAHFLAQKQKQQGTSSSSSSSARPGSSSSARPGSSVDAQRNAEMKRREEMEKRQRLQQKQQHERRMHEQQQQKQQLGPPTTSQPPSTQQQPPSAPQPTQQPPPQQQEAQQSAPPTAKSSRPSSQGTGGKGGKKTSTGGKQAGGKTGKKARAKPQTSAAAGPGRGSKSGSTMAQSPLAGQQSPSGQSTQGMMTPNPIVGVMDSSTRPPSPPPVREYSQLMEQVEHSVDFDWTAAGLIMGSNLQKLQLQEEQKNLLYGSTATYNSASAKQQQTPTSSNAARGGEEGKIPFALRGWGKRNVVSPRVAWCRARRREQPSEQNKARFKELYPDARMAVPASAWVNEDKAEEDAALCLLSEATQIYITQVLQKALVCARQRQNLDGIRLWHQQCTAAMEHAKGKKDGENGGGDDKKFEPPPLSIKLGCDVSRQAARTAGNAALTSKRMEEALGRAKTQELTRVIPSKEGFQMDEATLMSASSMGELSLLAPLGNAVDKADYEAKRQFEVYGGKHAIEPPFGRVPKRAKLEASDFQRGLELNHFLGGRQSRRHRANPAAFSWNVQG
ncbi:expressed unknown protein [Seminavis robusta]|uniref:Uncharacterized protein n=1 Tax=Seminavis robusta TaxID=568900 RepID=A0A9N8F2N7_9STRA|nr:expressed unknown protein [Seminavis robusta]|eukprot:Sro2462_g328350.1 n/a (985) ;mRNA; f:7913-10867